jgi:hypothetical protein
MSVLESDVHHNNNKISNLANLSNLSAPSINPMAMSEMNPMAMNPMAMNQMAMPGMNQMAMPGMNMMGSQANMDNIDSLMVNTLVPVNNSSMNFDRNTLMNPTQMASNLGSLAKLSNLNSHENFNNMGMNQMTNFNNMGMNQMTNSINQQQNSGLNLKNLAKLNI